MNTYESWPFRPFRQRTVGESETWWQTCHVPAPITTLLDNSPHWTIISGGPGSGKSVAVRALMRQQQETIFFVSYPPLRWPGAAQAPHPDADSHLPQMLATAALALRDHLTQQPQHIEGLSAFELEFLRWLFERYLGRRAYHRLVRLLPERLRAPLFDVPDTNLFPDADEPLVVQAQIDELVCLIQALGFERLLFVVDLNNPGTVAQKQGLADLFGWLELTHHPGFAVVAAAPQALLDDSVVVTRARGRARLIRLTWSESLCHKVVERHIAQATTDKLCLPKLATDKLLHEMATLIVAEYGDHVPAGWVGLAETLLYLTQRPAHKAQLSLQDLTQVQRTFFIRHHLLRIDAAAHGIWRGPRFIRLDEQPLNFLLLLQKRRGHPINWDDAELRLLTGSKNNMHSIASRTRKAIEPIPKDPVYLINRRGEGGYWLQNIVNS